MKVLTAIRPTVLSTLESDPRENILCCAKNHEDVPRRPGVVLLIWSHYEYVCPRLQVAIDPLVALFAHSVLWRWRVSISLEGV